MNNGISVSEFDSDIDKLSSEGKMTVVVASGEKALGVIGISDTVRAEAPQIVKKLKMMKIRTVLLTGDGRASAEYTGSAVGVDEIFSEVLPSQKAEVVENLRKNGYKVMMVGDGINDAPALVKADTGCAVGCGSDIAIDSADIVLMKNDLNDVIRAINLSKFTVKNIKFNLFWAFLYNSLGIPVAAGILYPFFDVLLSPMIGAAAMSLSSLFVVGNALRLRTKKLDKISW